INEVSKDGCMPNQAYGRSHKGRRAEMNQSWEQGICISMTALLTVNSIDTAMVVQNGMNREKFLEFLQGWVV
ncbi:hypothetical protein K488DRAFT_12436, partial [Vararia minispora EC-137]